MKTANTEDYRVDDLTAELMQELEMFRADWREKYSSVGAAALAAGVDDLYQRWSASPPGKAYADTFTGVPDHVGESRRAAAAEAAQPASLPFGYSNLSWVPREFWDGEGQG